MDSGHTSQLADLVDLSLCQEVPGIDQAHAPHIPSCLRGILGKNGKERGILRAGDAAQ